MKNLLSFTLAAGVALTTTTVAHGAGVSKTVAGQTGASARQVPAAVSTLAGSTFDRAVVSRELARISELLNPMTGDDYGLTEETTVSRKVSPAFTF